MIRFTPNGMLDVSSDPCDLPEQAQDRHSVSGAMTRCTNLSLDQMGIAKTRNGCGPINMEPIDTTISDIAEQSGYRYEFGYESIYRNEEIIKTPVYNYPWSTMLYNAYNSTTEAVFALNGSNHRFRIEGTSVNNCGIDAPTTAPTTIKGIDFIYTYDWEETETSTSELTLYEAINDVAYTYDWEVDDFGASDWVGYYAWPIANDVLYLSARNPCFRWEVQLYTTLVRYTLEEVTPDRILQFGTEADDEEYVVVFGWEARQVEGYESVFSDPNGYVFMYWFEDDSVSINDEYKIVYTYCRKSADGILECESNPSPSNSSLIVSGLSIRYTAPTDPQVTHVRFYRTLANMGDYYYDGEIAITETTYNTVKSDSQLGAEVETDHNRPPRGTLVEGPTYNGNCFIGIRNLLYFCKPQQPEYWPSLYYLEISPLQFPVMGIAIFSGQVFVATNVDIYQIQGTGPTSFFPIKLAALTGTQGKKCFLPVSGHGIFHLGNDGIYLFKVGSDQKITDANFGPIFDGETVGSIPGFNKKYSSRSWMIQYAGKMYFGYTSFAASYPADVLVFDLATMRPVHYQYPFEIRAVAVDNKNDRLIAACTDGRIRVLDCPGTTDDTGTAIPWDIESKQFNQLSKYFPRYARYDVSLVNGATATGELRMDGEVKQTHAITESRKTRKRLIASCTGDRPSIRIHGTGPVSIYSAELE